LSDIFAAVNKFCEQHSADKLRIDFLIKANLEKQKQREDLSKNTILLEDVRVFLQELAEVTRNEIMCGLQDIVTLCLQSVFGPDVRFEIEVGTSRNNTSIDFFVVSEEGSHVVRMRPEDSMGGGVIDTISIGLRFGLMKILNPLPIGPVIFDEPAKMVSGDRIESIGQLIKDMSRLFNKQIIMVTHHSNLADVADCSVLVQKQNGISTIS
jgi:DNA repair exonuclease SbcCD ATPase subunit